MNITCSFPSLYVVNKKEYEIFTNILKDIRNNQLSDLDVKKLTGHADVYRVRKRKVRIIFSKRETGIEVLYISNRDENTYRNY